MAHYDLEEQEQIDSLKTWWKMYGNLVTTVITALAVVMLGWQGWNWYQNGQTAKAAQVFASLEQGLEAGDAQKVKTAAGELAEKYGRSAYAGLAAMLAAKQSFDAGDLKTARAQLTWVVDNAKGEVRDVARLRLAGIALDEQAYDDALKQLDGVPLAAFEARFQEMKGDVLFAQGKKAEARTAYQSALDKSADKPGLGRDLLQQKLDNLGDAA